MNQNLKTGEVFVPGLEPKYTYNPRAGLQLEDMLQNYLDDGGEILAVSGTTKTGKSVLLRKEINDPVWIEGQSVTSLHAFWELVGFVLGATMPSGFNKTSGQSNTAKGGVNVVFFNGGADINSTFSEERQAQAISSLEASVKNALKTSGRPLIVDDFHFIDFEVQQEVVRAVKPLVFGSLRVIFVSISHRRNDAALAVRDMVGRIKPLHIALWSEDELMQIASDGFGILNVLDPEEEIAKELASMSFGSPHIMQKLCRELVRSENKVRSVSPTPKTLQPPTEWEQFFRSQTDDTMGKWFDRLFRGPLVKGTPRAKWESEGVELDSYGLVLKAISRTGPKLNLTLDEVREGIASLVSTKGPEKHQITRSLKHMSKIACMTLEAEMTEEEMDEAEVVFQGVQPVFEFIEDGATSTIHLPDPFFAYFLKWGTEHHFSTK